MTASLTRSSHGWKMASKVQADLRLKSVGLVQRSALFCIHRVNWLVIYSDGLPAREQSPTQVITWHSVEIKFVGFESTGGPTTQVCRLCPKVGGRLVLFCIHR